MLIEGKKIEYYKKDTAFSISHNMMHMVYWRISRRL